MLAGACLLTVFSGCGSDAAEGGKAQTRATASGTVTFKGQPIPAGSVTFTHLDSGVYSNCPIDDGTYESERNEGPVIGKNTVNIVGLESEGGKPQWSGVWSQQVDVAGEDFVLNLEVKEDEVKPYKSLLKEGEADEDAPLY